MASRGASLSPNRYRSRVIDSPFAGRSKKWVRNATCATVTVGPGLSRNGRDRSLQNYFRAVEARRKRTRVPGRAVSARAKKSGECDLGRPRAGKSDKRSCRWKVKSWELVEAEGFWGKLVESGKEKISVHESK